MLLFNVHKTSYNHLGQQYHIFFSVSNNSFLNLFSMSFLTSPFQKTGARKFFSLLLITKLLCFSYGQQTKVNNPPHPTVIVDLALLDFAHCSFLICFNFNFSIPAVVLFQYCAFLNSSLLIKNLLTMSFNYLLFLNNSLVINN